MSNDDVLKHLQGRTTSDGVEPKRVFDHGQHKHTRADIAAEAERTRLGVVEALAISNAQLKNDLALEFAAQVDRVLTRIEELAGVGPDGQPSDTQAIANAVVAALREHPLAPR